MLRWQADGILGIWEDGSKSTLIDQLTSLLVNLFGYDIGQLIMLSVGAYLAIQSYRMEFKSHLGPSRPGVCAFLLA